MLFQSNRDLRCISGIITALLTPFNNHGEAIDYSAVRELVDWQISKGVHCLFPAGTSGEGMLLSHQERKILAEVVCDQVQGRIPVIIHVGEITTKGSCELALHAEELQADAVSIITPYYYKVRQEDIIKHFVAVANSIPELPVLIYNNPATAGNGITIKVLKEVKEQCPNVIGIKDSSKDLMLLQQYKSCLDSNDVLLVGGDGIFQEALEIGVQGAISTISNVFPQAMIDIYEAWKLGDKDKITSSQKRVKELLAILTKAPYYAVCKMVLEKIGVSAGEVRPPMGSLTSEEENAIFISLKEINAI